LASCWGKLAAFLTIHSLVYFLPQVRQGQRLLLNVEYINL
jgi:hypothetical protein